MHKIEAKLVLQNFGWPPCWFNSLFCLGSAGGVFRAAIRGQMWGPKASTDLTPWLQSSVHGTTILQNSTCHLLLQTSGLDVVYFWSGPLLFLSTLLDPGPLYVLLPLVRHTIHGTRSGPFSATGQQPLTCTAPTVCSPHTSCYPLGTGAPPPHVCSPCVRSPWQLDLSSPFYWKKERIKFS